MTILFQMLSVSPFVGYYTLGWKYERNLAGHGHGQEEGTGTRSIYRAVTICRLLGIHRASTILSISFQPPFVLHLLHWLLIFLFDLSWVLSLKTGRLNLALCNQQLFGSKLAMMVWGDWYCLVQLIFGRSEWSLLIHEISSISAATVTAAAAHLFTPPLSLPPSSLPPSPGYNLGLITVKSCSIIHSLINGLSTWTLLDKVYSCDNFLFTGRMWDMISDFWIWCRVWFHYNVILNGAILR